MVQPAPGVLLVAEPFMPDPNFARTVVLLVEHNIQGSFGVVLNRPAPVQVKEVTDFFGEISHGLYLGGPVETKVLHALHSIPPLEAHSQKVMEHLYWTADMRAIRGILAAREIPEKILRFYAGYAGWAPGQLDQELALNSWITVPARREYIFSSPNTDLWRKVLTDMGGKYAFIATFPRDPRLN
ncbi:MAG: YqgE/AlgH family protein [Bacteroidia bacterium]|nr:YqgE/AlgH family protein [Bacteroidia bacterium]MCX7652861.1 YqgE/AlgH family protein [Bacteroidia bacterium]MDW8417489.1 YqgE/AlgH family protein [Bacteroidia bacterium]